jgi:hypothetical protein
MAKNKSRNKGHAFERELAQLWRELGYSKCKTSRYESKALDDMKVDLTNTHPFYVQAKNVENLGSAHKVLASMPNEKEKINIVFHKKIRQGTIVSMMQDDFINLLQLMIKCGIIKPK